MANAVAGQVLRRQYLGSKTAYRVRLASGDEIRVERHEGQRSPDFGPGDAVQVLIPADSRVVAA